MRLIRPDTSCAQVNRVSARRQLQPQQLAYLTSLRATVPAHQRQYFRHFREVETPGEKVKALTRPESVGPFHAVNNGSALNLARRLPWGASGLARSLLSGHLPLGVTASGLARSLLRSGYASRVSTHCLQPLLFTLCCPVMLTIFASWL